MEQRFKFYDKKTGKLLENCSMWWNYIEYLNQEDVVVCSSLPINDADGDQIFFGDILGDWGEAMWAVLWDKKYGKIMLGKNGVGVFAFSKISIKGKKIVGNIYENPELLK